MVGVFFILEFFSIICKKSSCSYNADRITHQYEMQNPAPTVEGNTTTSGSTFCMLAVQQRIHETQKLLDNQEQELRQMHQILDNQGQELQKMRNQIKENLSALQKTKLFEERSD